MTAHYPKSKAWRCTRVAQGSRLLALSACLLAAEPRPALAIGAVAVAGSADERRTLAKAKYAEGVEAYRGARYVDAVRLFLEADAISPSAALSYNIARAYEKLADDAQTLRWYRNYLRLNPQAKNASEVEGYIRSLSGALAKRGIQQMTVLTSPAGATVTIDGTPLGVTPLTVELPPGSHSALVSLRGFSDVTGNFVLPPQTPIDLQVVLRVTKVSSQPPSDAHQDTERRFGIVPYLTLGAAAVCLGSAGVFELSRRSAQNSARNEQVQLDYERNIAAMNSRQTTARVLLGVGSALAVTGVALLVLDAELGPKSRARVAGVPGGATLSLERRF